MKQVIVCKGIVTDGKHRVRQVGTVKDGGERKRVGGTTHDLGKTEIHSEVLVEGRTSEESKGEEGQTEQEGVVTRLRDRIKWKYLKMLYVDRGSDLIFEELPS